MRTTYFVYRFDIRFFVDTTIINIINSNVVMYIIINILIHVHFFILQTEALILISFVDATSDLTKRG